MAMKHNYEISFDLCENPEGKVYRADVTFENISPDHRRFRFQLAKVDVERLLSGCKTVLETMIGPRAGGRYYFEPSDRS